jgi:DNA-binding NtrC family response regulator
VKYFLLQFKEKLKKEITGITPQTMSALKSYSWPGNIRQLENVIERMVLMCESQILTVDDLPEELSALVPAQPAEAQDEPTSLKQIVRRKTQSLERDLIEKALDETRGNVTRTAEKLGLSRKGLQLKMKELGLKRPFD